MPPKTPNSHRADPWGTERREINSYTAQYFEKITENIEKNKHISKVLGAFRESIIKQIVDF